MGRKLNPAQFPTMSTPATTGPGVDCASIKETWALPVSFAFDPELLDMPVLFPCFPINIELALETGLIGRSDWERKPRTSINS